MLKGINHLIFDMGGTLELHRRWYDDARPALSRLAPHFKLYIAANQGNSARVWLEREGAAHLFSGIYLSESIGILKPDPEFFRLIVLNEGLNPARTLMVGDDLENDVAPAQALGMKAAWIRRGPGLEFARRSGLEERIHPDYTIESLIELA